MNGLVGKGRMSNAKDWPTRMCERAIGANDRERAAWANGWRLEGWAWRLDLWRCCSVLFGAAAWRLDLGSKDVSVKARELLLNEIGNRRTRKTCLRNRLTLAKQGQSHS